MYIYEFVRIELKSGFLKLKPEDDYQEVIKYYASDGWRFKQIFDPGIGVNGAPKYFDLIFEKEIDV